MLLSFCLLALGCDSSSTEGSTVEPAPQADTAVEYSDEELRKLQKLSGPPQPPFREGKFRGPPTPTEIQDVCKNAGVFSHEVGLFEVQKGDLDLLSIPAWLDPDATAMEPGALLYGRVKQANSEGHKVLLLLHGTKLQTWPGFVGLASTIFPKPDAEGQQTQPIVLAFDHRASTKGMCTNLQSFKAKLDAWEALTGEPIHISVDILAMSRGGLLAQFLSQPAAVQAHCPELIAEHGQDWLAPHRLEIHKTILLATPNSGSSLARLHPFAAKRLGCTYANAEQIRPAPPEEPETVEKWKKPMAGALGQRPGSRLLTELHAHPPSAEHTASTWVIASNYRPEPPDVATQKIYDMRANDLVVDLFSSFYRVTKGGKAQQVAPKDHSFIVPEEQYTSHLGTPYNASVNTCVGAILWKAEDEAVAACSRANLEQRPEEFTIDLKTFF